jgi:hypothetical protein
MLISVKPAFGFAFGRNLLACFEVCRDRRQVQRCADAQRSPEGPAADGEREAVALGVKPGASPRETAPRVGRQQESALLVPDRDHSQ